MYIPWMCWIFCPRIRREMATLDEEPEDDPLDWELEKIEKLKRLADAMVKLGDWKVDRRCPQSTSGGMVARRFILVDKKAKKACLARLISLGDKDFRIQRGLVQDLDEEEDALDDDPDGGEDDAGEDDGSRAGEPSRRGAAAPKCKGKSAAAAAPEAAPKGDKRRRGASGK